jgi:ADP-ribose pyrophosphatase YjhB (NUDIX family)
MMKKTLLKIWRELPPQLQLIAVRLLRPRYRVAVAAIILDEDKRILLCEHTYRKFHPWGLPGGGLEYGESPECGIQREVWEETGYEVDVEKLLSAESSKDFHHVSLIYLCKITGGSFLPNLETAQTRFFALDRLPDLLYTEKLLLERVADQLSL